VRLVQHEGCVVPLRDAADPAWAGAKAATLARLARAGFPVPDGLVLTVPAFEALREHAALGARPTPAEVCAAPLPPVVVAALESVAAHFADVPVAVRSSAVAEDLPDASYAGQYDTVLGVVGLTALREAVRRCWASAFAARVHEYAADHAADHASGSRPIAVLVQEQVEADVAGIAFTADPVTGARGAVLVSAAPGLGDAVARVR
jgi:pyruvate,water dikinase